MTIHNQTKYTEQDFTRLALSTGKEILNKIGVELNLDNRNHINLLSCIQSSLIAIQRNK